MTDPIYPRQTTFSHACPNSNKPSGGKNSICDSNVNGDETLWELEKMLVASIFSYSRENQSLHRAAYAWVFDKEFVTAV